jgi:hypothetical protein
MGPFPVRSNLLLADRLGLTFARKEENAVMEGDLDLLARNSGQIQDHGHRLGVLADIQVGAIRATLVGSAGDPSFQLTSEERRERGNIGEG